MQSFNKSGTGAGSGLSQQRMLELMDEKQILQHEIEQEKDKIIEKEKKQRDELDKLRKIHQENIDDLNAKYDEKRKYIDSEKQKLIEDKTRTIELEKNKLASLQKIDSDNRESAQKREDEKLREVYESQHSSLRKQLEQKIQMNKLAEEVSKSSSDINSMIQKKSIEEEGQLKQRE